MSSRVVVGMAAAAGLGLLGPATAYALDPGKSLSECTVEVLGIRDGLTGASIRSITQTADGYLWIGADGGVRRYDGSRVARIEIVPSDRVIGVVPQSSGAPLVVLRRDLVCIEGGALVSCGAGVSEQPRGKFSAAARGERNANLWLATERGQLLRMREGRVAEVFELGERGFGTISAIHEDARGRLWIGTSLGLFLAPASSPHADAFLQHEDGAGPIAAPVRSIFEGQGERLWVLTDQALYRITGHTTETYRQPEGLAAGWRSEAIEDRHGSVWIGTQSGLVRFRGGSFAVFTRRHGLPDDDVSALFEDREGSLWVGTRSGALAQFTDRTVGLRAGPPSLREASIESICEDNQGALWFATWFGLIRWKDGREQTFTRADGLPDTHVSSVLPGDGDEVWIGTQAGLARWRNGRIEKPVPFARSVVSLSLDARKSLWLGTNDGLWRLQDGRLEPIPPAPGARPGQIRGVQQDDGGLIWVTTVGGLHQVVEGRLMPAQSLLGQTGPAERAITRDDDGTVWFGAGSTLVRRRAGGWHFFTPANGLPDDPIYQVISDGIGYLWLSTSRALVRVDKRELESLARAPASRLAVLSFDTSEDRREIAGRRSRTPGAWRSRDGRLWFATLRGVADVDPGRLPINDRPPPVLIETAVVDGKQFSSAARAEFPPGPGNLEFHFAGVTLVEPQKAMHRYRLHGFDRSWIEAGPRRVAYYTNLPPGRYRFEVQASNADGVWNQAGASLELRLLPRFYRTWWFYLVVALGIAATAFALYRTRLRRLRAQFLAVFAERNRVARELHDSLLQAMAAAALEIANVREQLPPSGNGLSARLETVENVISTSLVDTRRLVWNLRDEAAGSGDLGQALWRLAGRLTEGRPVACTVDAQGQPRTLPQAVQGGLFRIAQEALTNAMNHAQAGHIELRLRYEPDTVTLSVHDDGRGFEADQVVDARAGHFGLLGMRERARHLGAELELCSESGRGTAVTVRLKTNGRWHAHGG